jgi:hypothetical protein
MIHLASLGGGHYFISFTNDFSHFTWLYFLKKKFEALQTFKENCAKVELQFILLKLLILYSDHRGEYVLGDFFIFCTKVSITHELTQAYTPSHNGVSEQKNHTFLEKVHLMVVDAQTLKFPWVNVVNTINYITNQSPTRANNGMTSYQKLFKVLPKLKHLQVWGCIVYVHEHDEQRTKLDSKNKRCIMVDYSNEFEVIKCYHPPTYKIQV